MAISSARAIDGEAQQGEAAEPVVFDNQLGLFTPAKTGGPVRNIAVLFINPWGLEDLLSRRFYRHLAETLAEQGVASLRFDLPGTGNALDPKPESEGLQNWIAAIENAVLQLKKTSGAKNIVLLGQGLGATLACRAVAGCPGVVGLALLAPVLKGRAYLRELALWSKLVSEGQNIGSEHRDKSPGSIAGFRMSQAVAEDLKRLDITKCGIDPRISIFLAKRPDAQNDAAFEEHAAGQGHPLTAVAFDGYEVMLSDLLPPPHPKTIGPELTSWLSSLQGADTEISKPERHDQPDELMADGFSELPLRFGQNNRLFGILCRPAGVDLGVTVIIATTGYDPMSGWGRVHVELARRLAAKGIASFRFDSAGAGESPEVPGRKKQALYDKIQLEDIKLARERIRDEGLSGKVMIYGRCSGGYSAFRAAVEDPAWDACIAVNPYGFRWRFQGLPRSLKGYWGRLTAPDFKKQLLSGELDIRAALQNIGIRALDRVAQPVSKVLPGFRGWAQLNAFVYKDFQTLADRGAQVTIIYSEGDEAQDSFNAHFRTDGSGLGDFPNAQFQSIPDADHNVTPHEAREKLLQIVEEKALLLARLEA